MTRPFKGLPLTVGPDPHYDVVVIGAGIGGLILGNLLAKKGLRALMVEQHYMVGGYCSTFRRKGYTFDAASHFYPLLGNPTTLTGKLLRDLDIDCDWIKMDPVDHFIFPDGSRFAVNAEFDIYLADLKAAFPEEASALDTFFAEVRAAHTAGLLYYFRGCRTKNLARWENLQVSEVLDRHFRDRKLKLLLTADCPHWGSPPDRTSFVFDAMLRLSYFLGNYYPKGGSQVFADSLAAGFERRGGHLLMKSAVVAVPVQDGRATGVVIETGPRHRRRRLTVSAEKVVAAGDVHELLQRLVAPSSIPSDYKAKINSLRASYPCYLCHLGLKGIHSETLAKVQGYYWNDWDPNRLGEGGLKFKLFVPTIYEPAMAPPGGQVLIIQKVMAENYHAIEDKKAHKQQVEAYMLNELARILPGIERHIVVATTAGAETSFRFTRNFHGAMLGWEMSPQQLGEDRPDLESPIRDLYLTGHWTRPGGGITPVIVSAMNLAKKLS